MRILQIDNHHRVLGGAERYYFDLAKLLRNKGHEIAFFSMLDPKSISTSWDKYFVGYINFGGSKFLDRLQILLRMFYSHEAKLKMRKLLDAFQPDMVHIHNIYYYLSPSILPEIKKRNIPIVQTVHDYHLISPNVNLSHNGRVCEITKRTKFYKAIFHKCVKNSYKATFMAVVASYIQTYFKLFKKNVDYFIAPSMFIKNKLIEYGFNSKKIVHLPNFTYFSSSPQIEKPQKERYVLYFGRLAEEKGIFFLLNLAEKLAGIKFKIVGDPPDESTSKQIVNLVKKNKSKNITLLGYQNAPALQKTILKSFFVIVPSLWYENMPYSILESYALGKPVVAADIGGIPEIVKDRKTGLLFKPGDLEDCKEKILWLWNNPKLIELMAKNAKKYAEAKFNPERHYEQLMKIYKRALKK